MARPRREPVKRLKIVFRVSLSDAATIRLAAEAARLPVSSYALTTLIRAAQREVQAAVATPASTTQGT